MYEIYVLKERDDEVSITLEQAKQILKENNQEHICNLLDKVSLDKQTELLKQIEEIDFKQIEELYCKTKEEFDFGDKKIEPISYLNKEKLSKEEKDYYDGLGRNIIENGKYAVVTMAGGKGTRLGHDGPKGTFFLDVKPDGKYIFQILAESLKKECEKYGVSIPWYIMTSNENDLDTKKFLEEKDYFGYDKNSVKFFRQGELPVLDVEGKLMINQNMQIKKASDGNGSIFASMKREGVLEDMKQKLVEWAFIGGVDNVLVQMADITLLGMAIDRKVKVAAKSIVKAGPKERVGVFCKQNGVPKVIEYTELPAQMAEALDENGELVYGESHVMCNLFSLEALEKISNSKLLYHVAFKKEKYLNEVGEFISPETPNAYKFEMFIFDAFELFDDIAILRGKREADFAPVKNAEGVDSPETARKLYNDFHSLN